MTRRTRIGANLGTFGYFLSRPGDDVAAPAKNLLVDSRFKTLNIHSQGIFTLTRYKNPVPAPNNSTIWYGRTTFPSLGYRPLFFFSLIYATNNGAGIPVNSAYYPSSWFSRDGPALGTTMAGSDLSVAQDVLDASGAWLEPDNSTISAKATFTLPSDGDIRCSYTVFKNPMESG